MKEQLDNLLDWIKKQDFEGCITGSCLLPTFFEDADIDVFVYDKKSLDRFLYAMFYNENFQILDPIENWKFDKYIKIDEKFQKFGVLSIKFTYNTCLKINVVLKERADNIFGVVSSFDMDLICKGYDIKTKQYLDLTGNSVETKIVDWNRWNKKYYDIEPWSAERLLRQIDRCIKYWKRGYNTDKVLLKYVSLIDNIIDYKSIFNSEKFGLKLEESKQKYTIVKEIIEKWLSTHEINDSEWELLKQLTKE